MQWVGITKHAATTTRKTPRLAGLVGATVYFVLTIDEFYKFVKLPIDKIIIVVYTPIYRTATKHTTLTRRHTMNYLGSQKLCSQGNYRTTDRRTAFDAAQELANMLSEPVAVCHGNGQYTTISHWSWDYNKFTKRYSGLAVISWLEPQVIA